MGELMPAFNLTKSNTDVMLPSIPDPIKSSIDQLPAEVQGLADKSENLDVEIHGNEIGAAEQTSP